LISKTSF